MRISAVYVVCATLSYVVVIASKIKLFHGLKHYSGNFLWPYPVKCISLSDCARITAFKIRETEVVARFSLKPYKVSFWHIVHEQYY